MRNRIICGNCGGEHIGDEVPIVASGPHHTSLLFAIPNRCEMCGCAFSFEPTNKYCVLLMPRDPR